jgi:hypothetical protein
VPCITLDGDLTVDLAGGTLTDTVYRYIERPHTNGWQTKIMPMRGDDITDVINIQYGGNSYIVFNVKWVDGGRTVTNTYIFRLVVAEN